MNKIWMCLVHACEAVIFAVGIIGIASMFVLALATLERPHYTPMYVVDNILEMDYDHRGKVTCDSNSMGVGLDCDDMIYGNHVTEDSVMIPGEIYTFHNDHNGSTVHRLAYCLDDNCNQMIFRGDNNKQGELVNRSQIISHVTMVRYG